MEHLEWDMRGTALLGQGQYHEAIQCFKKALELQPDYVPSLYNLGLAYLDIQQFNEAIECWERVLKIQPDHQPAAAAIAKVRPLAAKKEPGQIRARPGAPIVIVADSNGDIPAELVERYGIHVVPSILILEGKSYRDGIDITRTEFYARLPALKTPPTTATPGAGDFEALYASLGDVNIISIHIASKLSAFYNTARVGAEASGACVTLIDSEQVSLGMGLQVLAAAEAVAAGKSVAEVVEVVNDVRRRLKLYATLDTLEYLRRGGRASNVKAWMGELLQVKPMLEVSGGQVLPLAQHRTRSKALAKLEEAVAALGPLERLAVAHAHSPDEGRALAERLAPQSAQPPLVVEICSVIGTHAGPGALGVVAVKVK